MFIMAFWDACESKDARVPRLDILKSQNLDCLLVWQLHSLTHKDPWIHTGNLVCSVGKSGIFVFRVELCFLVLPLTEQSSLYIIAN